MLVPFICHKTVELKSSMVLVLQKGILQPARSHIKGPREAKRQTGAKCALIFSRNGLVFVDITLTHTSGQTWTHYRCVAIKHSFNACLFKRRTWAMRCNLVLSLVVTPRAEQTGDDLCTLEQLLTKACRQRHCYVRNLNHQRWKGNKTTYCKWNDRSVFIFF